MGLPIEWYQGARARPGKIGVVRDATDEKYGGIIYIPDGVRQGQKAPEGLITSIGDGVPSEFEFGARVVLAAGVTRRVPFGNDEKVVYLATPEQLLMELWQEGAVRTESSTYRPYLDPATQAVREDVADTGAPKNIRQEDD